MRTSLFQAIKHCKVMPSIPLKIGRSVLLLPYLTGLCLLFGSCLKKHENTLPILGEREVKGSDTVYHTIPAFTFIDQDSMPITNKTFDNKIYIADFFFTSCQTICPIMKTQMRRVYESTQDMNDVALLSHTIDPKRDTVALLHDYAQKMDINTDKWHFATGIKDSIYKIAQNGYFATTVEDNTTLGGFIHSGSFLLIDKERHIRGQYNGTNKDDVSRLIEDIKKLRLEYK